MALLLISLSGVSAQDGIRWMTWDEVVVASKAEERKIFVDLYTEWCSWCKKMDAKTLSKPHIVDFINNNYYAVKFDAQHKEDIELNGRTYSFVRNGRNSFNELAIELTKGKLSFPTIVFLDPSMDVIQPIPGFQDANNFEKIMTYFAGDFHISTPWREYSRSYNSQYILPASTGGQ